jgi:transcriptional regulator with XRE-family HTH domain
MSIIVDDLDARLGARIRQERESRGWSLTELAQRSGVSRAMINKVERGQASPTAALLGRLCGAFGLSLSTLLARTEAAAPRQVQRAEEQAQWRDPASGYVRRQVAPAPGSDLPLDLVRVELPPGARVSFPASAYAQLRHLVWVLKGRLHFIEGEREHVLDAGDCLELGPPSACTYSNPRRTACTYAVIVLRPAR